MGSDEIRELISRGGDHYLRILADAEHMELHDDGFSTLIRPKPGEQGGTSIFNFRFDGMSEEEIEGRIAGINESGIHAYWARLPENVRRILAKYQPVVQGNDDDAEADMAMFPREKPEYPPAVHPVSVKLVDTPQDFAVWAGISNGVLHGGYPILHPINHYHLCETGKMACYLGFYGSIPVSTSAFLTKDGMASLEFVATLADYRRMGVGRAVCARAVDDAILAGAWLVTLRAFGVAKTLYGTMGFMAY